jgi:hypothetical protein
MGEDMLAVLFPGVRVILEVRIFVAWRLFGCKPDGLRDFRTMQLDLVISVYRIVVEIEIAEPFSADGFVLTVVATDSYVVESVKRFVRPNRVELYSYCHDDVGIGALDPDAIESQ